MATRIVRVPCEGNASYVLLHVTATGGLSRAKNLDLSLIGTEGAAPYVRDLKHSGVPSLKAKNSSCDGAEWQMILESVLLGRIQEGAEELLRGVEAVAVVEDEKAITIKVQRRVGVEGITQLLGSFKLSHKPEEEIDPFEWCGIAVESNRTLTDELAKLKSKLQSQEDISTQLKSQLEDFIKVKTDHDHNVVENFRLILNEKKLKIRSQSRLLAFAKVDPKELAKMEASRKGRSAGASRSGKRKGQSPDDSDDDVFEKMDVDEEKEVLNEDDSDTRDALTPEASDDETTDEDDEPEPPAPAPAKNTRSSKAIASHPGKASNKAMEIDQDMSTPPPRELPFAKKKAAPKKASPPAKQAVVDEEGDTESDDEL